MSSGFQIMFPNYIVVDFNNHKIWCTLYSDVWWFVISDVVAALIESINPLNFLKDLKRRKPGFKKRVEAVATPLTMKTKGGQQKVNCVNLDELFNLIKLLPSEKISQFKRFIASNPLFINKAKIAYLKNEYHFASSFDLCQEISHLPTACVLYPSFLRISKKRKELLDLLSTLRTARRVFKSTSAETKIDLNQIPQELKKIGYKDIRGELTDWSITKTEEYLEVAYQTCLFSLENTPKDPGGRQVSSKSLHIIFKLVDIYSRGTKRKPTCGWDDVSDKHVGDFYNFVIALLPVLKSLNLRLGKSSSIGTYCREAITHYQQVLNQHQQ